jgi:GNAT superfamily N-acetyltransferase
MRRRAPYNLVRRTWAYLFHYGLKATIHKAIQNLIAELIYVDETHVWYELPLRTDRPRVDKLLNLSLIRTGVRDLPLLHQLATDVSVYEARHRIEAGHDLWVALKGQKPVFACWVFRGSLPVLASRNGHITLPPETVAFEDSVASPAYRNRGIGLVVWPKIADRLEQSTAKTIITRVGEDNATARRAFEKSGFREVATVHFRRRGPWRELTMRVGNSATAGWLAEQIAR